MTAEEMLEAINKQYSIYERTDGRFVLQIAENNRIEKFTGATRLEAVTRAYNKLVTPDNV